MVKTKTKRLIIRDHIIEDFHFLHKLMSDDKAMYYLQDIKTKILQESRDNLLESIRQATLQNREKYYFAIFMKETKEYIGEVGFSVKNNNYNALITAGLGYFILPQFWGQGITTEAVNAVINYALTKTNIQKIESGCAKTNAASERIMQKVGMTKEREIKNYALIESKMHDRVEYGLIKEDW